MSSDSMSLNLFKMYPEVLRLVMITQDINHHKLRLTISRKQIGLVTRKTKTKHQKKTLLIYLPLVYKWCWDMGGKFSRLKTFVESKHRKSNNDEATSKCEGTCTIKLMFHSFFSCLL